MNKCVVLFVEGDTEVEFYKKVIDSAKNLRSNKVSNIKTVVKNLKGIGNFKKEALGKFVKDIKPKNNNCEFTIVLCRDTDVFEMAQSPKINWNKLETDFLNNGATNVIHIEAKHSIEDWFLYDIDGIISYLRLKPQTKVIGNTGVDKLRHLYKLANKIYVKGNRSNGLINQLNIDKITNAVKNQLEPLYKALGVDSFK